jgi:hypothetical protein
MSSLKECAIQSISLILADRVIFLQFKRGKLHFLGKNRDKVRG